jgi:hypothetical protein
MKISGAFSLVLVNPASEKQFANLSQTSTFFLSDLQNGILDLARYSEADPFVLGGHAWADSRRFVNTSQIIFLLDEVSTMVHNVEHW